MPTVLVRKFMAYEQYVTNSLALNKTYCWKLTLSLHGEEDIVLNEGELYVVKKGNEHRIQSEEECRIMLIENKSTEHTGNVKTGITKTIDEQFY